MLRTGLASALTAAMIGGCVSTAVPRVSPGSVSGSIPEGWICTDTYCKVPARERAAAIREHPVMIVPAQVDAAADAAYCPPCPACPRGGPSTK